MIVYFIVDEYTDVEDADRAAEMVDIIIDALKNPHRPRPEGEVILGEIIKQFWSRAIQSASLTSQQHFLDDYITTSKDTFPFVDRPSVLSLHLPSLSSV